MGAAGAAVRDRGAVGPEEGEAPAGARVTGGGFDEAAGVAGVGQSPAAGFAGGGGPAEDGAGRDGEVDQRRERGRRAGRDTAAVRVVVVFGGAAALVLPLGHVGAAVPAGVVIAVAGAVAVAGLAACGRLVLAGVPPGSVSGLGAGKAVQRVAALGQVVEGQHPQPLQGAGQPAACAARPRARRCAPWTPARPRSPAPGRTGTRCRTPPARLPPAAGLRGPCSLPRCERFRVEFHRHRGGLAGQLVIPQPRREGGEDLISVGGISIRQVPGGPPDQPGPVLIDQPGAQRGPGAGQPGLAGRRPGPSGRAPRSAR